MNSKKINVALISAVTSLMLAAPAAVSANEAGDILVKAGLAFIDPDSGKSPAYVGGDYAGADLTVGDDTQLLGNFAYFFNANWAIEAIVATPFTHDVALGGGNIAEVTHLPPIVSALYYFDTASAFQPYVGVGINYTFFWDEKFNSATQGAGYSNLSLDSSVGLAVQAGFDYYLDEAWFVNASVRYAYIQTDITFDVAGGSALGGKDGSSTIDINPMVYSLTVGYKF
ncbi:MAG: outer membrane beta-barrel protein [Colwellia sp.]|nr:outer membrane beta-barrel protein [Colwellia sp.]